MALEDRVYKAFEETQVVERDQGEIFAFLQPLRIKHLPTFEHSLRVGLVSRSIAKAMHLSEKALLFPGLLHDVGKAQVELSTLSKTEGWTKKDTQRMHPHVMLGYRMVRDRFDFSAEVILWHHRFQFGGYPGGRMPLLHNYGLGTKVMIPFYGRLLALVDFYDALHRVNDHSGEVKGLTGEEIREQMLKHNQDQKQLIEALYGADVFTTYTA
ncbi:MAG: HD domain-containing protein [Candidatus Buchananbacteria bacterium]